MICWRGAPQWVNRLWALPERLGVLWSCEPVGLFVLARSLCFLSLHFWYKSQLYVVIPSWYIFFIVSFRSSVLLEKNAALASNKWKRIGEVRGLSPGSCGSVDSPSRTRPKSTGATAQPGVPAHIYITCLGRLHNIIREQLFECDSLPPTHFLLWKTEVSE